VNKLTTIIFLLITMAASEAIFATTIVHGHYTASCYNYDKANELAGKPSYDKIREVLGCAVGKMNVIEFGSDSPNCQACGKPGLFKCRGYAIAVCEDKTAEIKAKLEVEKAAKEKAIAEAKLEAEIKAKEAAIAKAEAKLAAEIKAEEEAQARLDAAVKPGDEGWVWTTDEQEATWESEHGNKNALDDFWDKLNNGLSSDEEDTDETDFEEALEADSGATNENFDFEKALEADSSDNFNFENELETGNSSEEFDFDSELAGVEDYRDELERERQEQARRQAEIERQRQAAVRRQTELARQKQKSPVSDGKHLCYYNFIASCEVKGGPWNASRVHFFGSINIPAQRVIYSNGGTGDLACLNSDILEKNWVSFLNATDEVSEWCEDDKLDTYNTDIWHGTFNRKEASSVIRTQIESCMSYKVCFIYEDMIDVKSITDKGYTQTTTK
jgi:hypothetical protein